MFLLFWFNFQDQHGKGQREDMIYTNESRMTQLFNGLD